MQQLNEEREGVIIAKEYAQMFALKDKHVDVVTHGNMRHEDKVIKSFFGAAFKVFDKSGNEVKVFYPLGFTDHEGNTFNNNRIMEIHLK